MRNDHPVNTRIKFLEVEGDCYQSRVYRELNASEKNKSRKRMGIKG